MLPVVLIRVAFSDGSCLDIRAESLDFVVKNHLGRRPGVVPVSKARGGLNKNGIWFGEPEPWEEIPLLDS